MKAVAICTHPIVPKTRASPPNSPRFRARTSDLLAGSRFVPPCPRTLDPHQLHNKPPRSCRTEPQPGLRTSGSQERSQDSPHTAHAVAAHHRVSGAHYFHPQVTPHRSTASSALGHFSAATPTVAPPSNSQQTRRTAHRLFTGHARQKRPKYSTSSMRTLPGARACCRERHRTPSRVAARRCCRRPCAGRSMVAPCGGRPAN